MNDEQRTKRAEEAVNAVLAPLGTHLRHYMPVHREDAVEAMAKVISDLSTENGRYWRDWAGKRQAINNAAWERAARAALSGDLRQIRNRVELIDAEPVDVVLSEDA